MRTRMLCVVAVALAMVSGAAGSAQEKPKSVVVPLRITVVLNEFDGSKKLTSLPYVMPCKASVARETSSLRMGFRVPYKERTDQIQYQDVGTDIDCRATPPDEQGGYLLELGVNYNAVYPPAAKLSSAAPSSSSATSAPVSVAISGDAPITGGFRANLTDVLLHDGQTVEAVSATDPVSGHLWKVLVTLSVVK